MISDRLAGFPSVRTPRSWSDIRSSKSALASRRDSAELAGGAAAGGRRDRRRFRRPHQETGAWWGLKIRRSESEGRRNAVAAATGGSKDRRRFRRPHQEPGAGWGLQIRRSESAGRRNAVVAMAALLYLLPPPPAPTEPSSSSNRTVGKAWSWSNGQSLIQSFQELLDMYKSALVFYPYAIFLRTRFSFAPGAAGVQRGPAIHGDRSSVPPPLPSPRPLPSGILQSQESWFPALQESRAFAPWGGARLVQGRRLPDLVAVFSVTSRSRAGGKRRRSADARGQVSREAASEIGRRARAEERG